jgi:hypothetical protein
MDAVGGTYIRTKLVFDTSIGDYVSHGSLHARADGPLAIPIYSALTEPTVIAITPSL